MTVTITSHFLFEAAMIDPVIFGFFNKAPKT